MAGIVFKGFAKISARWHWHWLRFDTAKIEKRMERGEPYTSPKLSGLSGRCATHGMKEVQAAKKGGFYKRGRMAAFPYGIMMEAEQRDALEQ